MTDIQELKIQTLAAKALHNVNRNYTGIFTKEDFQPDWGELTPEAQERLAGITLIIRENPDRLPEDNHASFLQNAMDDGWTFGPERDEKAKISPYICVWEELTDVQKAKSRLGAEVVKAIWRSFGWAV